MGFRQRWSNPLSRIADVLKDTSGPSRAELPTLIELLEIGYTPEIVQYWHYSGRVPRKLLTFGPGDTWPSLTFGTMNGTRTTLVGITGPEIRPKTVSLPGANTSAPGLYGITCPI